MCCLTDDHQLLDVYYQCSAVAAVSAAAYVEGDEVNNVHTATRVYTDWCTLHACLMVDMSMTAWNDNGDRTCTAHEHLCRISHISTVCVERVYMSHHSVLLGMP